MQVQRIQNNNNQNSTSFKQVNIVRISKKATPSKYNDTKSTLLFEKALTRAGIKNDHLSFCFALKDGIEALVTLEKEGTPRYTNFPLHKDYHTFLVLTGKEKDECSKLINESKRPSATLVDFSDVRSNPVKVMNAMIALYMEHQLPFPKLQEYCEKIRKILADKNYVEFKIQSLDDIQKIKPNLGLECSEN